MLKDGSLEDSVSRIKKNGDSVTRETEGKHKDRDEDYLATCEMLSGGSNFPVLTTGSCERFQVTRLPYKVVTRHRTVSRRSRIEFQAWW